MVRQAWDLVGGDPIEKLQEFINRRWAVIQPTVFPSVAELRFSLDELTRTEAEWFLEAVVPQGHEPALFTVEDNNKHLCVRHPPNVGGTPRGNVFFEKSLSGNWCVLRLETVVHQGVTWRLHDEFGWPLSHLIVESPDVFDAGEDVLRREALDILALEKPCEELPSKMELAAARPRVGVEVKATSDQLDHLLQGMQHCHGDPNGGHRKSDHAKCRAISYSELASYLECPRAFRLRSLVGFQPRLAPELGYGKAVHHVLRAVADQTKSEGHVPTEAEVDEILDASFFLPTANKPAHRLLKRAARTLVTEYVNDHSDDLYRVWETERPFELHLEGVTVAGRADVILDEEGGVPTALALLDYKTSTRPDEIDHSLQLQVYADAGRREGLDVRGAYVHDLKAGKRLVVDVEPPAVSAAETVVQDAATRLLARDYAPNPGARCRRCEVRTICDAAKR